MKLIVIAAGFNHALPLAANRTMRDSSDSTISGSGRLGRRTPKVCLRRLVNNR
jgi:hypothetical protein